MIGVFYIGEPRFTNIGLFNHQKLYSRLRENWPIEIYDYTWNQAWPRDCASDLAGVVQVWDFYQGLSRVPEKYIIKIRTDVWFTDAAVDAVVKEMGLIVDGHNDLSYIGMELTTDYAETYNRIEAKGIPKVQDFVIAANRTRIAPDDSAMWSQNSHKKLKSGNRTFKTLMLEDTQAYTVRTTMPLIRRHYDNPTDWEITYDFVNQYNKVEQARAWWYLKKPKDNNA